MSDTITCIKNGFTYRIKYDKRDNSVSFHAIHNTEFLEWTKIINDNLMDGTSEQIKVSLSPKNLHKLFYDYVNNRLSERYVIVMPEQDSLTNVAIQIHSTMEYQDEIDIKTIILEPVDIPFETRSDRKLKLKLEMRDKHFETELDVRDKRADLKLQSISTQLECIQVEHLQDLVTRIDQLHTLVKTVSDDSMNNRIVCDKMTQQLESISDDIDECIDIGTKNSFDALYERFSKRIEKVSTNIYRYFPDLTNLRKKCNQCYDVVSTNINKRIDNIKRKPFDNFTALCYAACIATFVIFIVIGTIGFSSLTAARSEKDLELKIKQLELELKEKYTEINELHKTISKLKTMLGRNPNNNTNNNNTESDSCTKHIDHITIILSYIITYAIVVGYIPTNDTICWIYVVFLAFCCWYNGFIVTMVVIWDQWMSLICYPFHCIGIMISLLWK